MLRNIMQTYTQSKIELNYIVIYHLPVKLKKKYFEDTILFIVKLLYGLKETKNYWFATYLHHYKKKLQIEMLPYNTYLLITQDNSKNFDIARLQIDNTYNVRIKAFMNKKKTEIIKTKFKIKTQTILETGASKTFNSCYIIIKAKFIIVIQKNQAEKLVFINTKNNIKKTIVYGTTRLWSLHCINILTQSYI